MSPARILLAALLAAGTARAAGPAPAATPPAAPAAKEVVALALRNAGLPLAGIPSCEGAGTSASDATLGDFLAGFLAEQTGSSGKNWIETECREAAPGKPRGWDCRLVVRRSDGEERWGWGVRFFVRASDRKPVRSSFACVGAG